MSLVNVEVIRSTKNAVVRRQFYFIAYNGIKLKADRLYKRFGDGGLILADASTSGFMVGINNN